MSTIATGALAGWKRCEGMSGIVLTMQIVESVEAYQEQRVAKVQVALNDRQLRSLARDLTRAASERGTELQARRPWWRVWG